MSRLKALFYSIKLTPWFFHQSWRYVVTRKLSSKIEYLIGIVPAWIRFTIYAYKDLRIE